MTPKTTARDRIIDAATELMWRDGYDAVSVDVICAAANVRKGSFYHAFASKEALLNTLIRRRWDIDRPQLEAIYATGASAQQKFREHIAWFGLSQQRLQSTYGFVPGVFNMAVGVNAPQSTRELIAERRNAHLAMITGAIRAIFAEEGLADDHIRWWATIAAQLISGANIEARLNNSLAPYDSLPDSVMAVLGLCAPPLLAKARPPID